MAQKVSVQLVDDLDGEVADETVEFSLDGTSYEVDLSAEHAAELRDAFAIYIGVGRRTGGRRPTRAKAASAPRRARSSAEPSASEVRAWGRENGFVVSDRGRVSAELASAYEAAH